MNAIATEKSGSALSWGSSGARSHRSWRGFDRTRVIYEARNVKSNEEQRNIPYANLDGHGMDPEQVGSISTGVASQGKGGRSSTLRDVSQRSEAGSENFVWD